MSGSTSGTDGPTQYGGQMPSCLRSGVEKRVELSHIDINYTEALALGQLVMIKFSTFRMACCCRCHSLRVCV